MKIHKLKCYASYFDAVEDGDKTFEVRINDRGYQKGDYLELTRTEDGSSHGATARRDGSYRPMMVLVTYVHPLGPLSPQHVVLAIKLIEKTGPSETPGSDIALSSVDMGSVPR